MEKKSCSLKDHNEIQAKIYCQDCKIYMCNKCEKIHSGLCLNHHSYNLYENVNELFTGLCKEENHNDELVFFCKAHNQLCCAKCIIKVNRKGYGQHMNCEICNIEDAKKDKKNALNENIKKLNKLSTSLKESTNKLKILFEAQNQNKEQLKMDIQKIFTKIRNTLNDREDQLLSEVDKYFIKEDIIKEGEKLPNKIKIYLEKGELINKEWKDDNKLNFIINDCLNIENAVKDINNINESLKKFSDSNYTKKIKFFPENDNNLNKYLEYIKNIGCISCSKYIFKHCPENVEEARKFKISGENENIMTKTGNSGSYSGAICKEELEKGKIHRWKIRILKTKEYYIKIGITTTDFNYNCPFSDRCGWYYFCKDGSLHCGPPNSYSGKKTNLNKNKDEIIIVFDMIKRTLKFIIDNEDKGESYTDIPIDKPIFPSILLYEMDDSVEISEC